MSSHHTFTIATFNIRVGVDSSLAHVASDCTQLQSDLLCLQEIGCGWNMGTAIHQTAYLAAAQQHPYYHFVPALTDSQGGQFGIATSSSYEIHTIQTYHLPQLKDEQRVCLLYQLFDSSQQSTLTVVTTHLSIYEQERHMQAQFIANLIQKITTPVIVIGDLNDVASSPTLQSLYACGLKDAWTEIYPQKAPQLGYTFSTTNPNRRIDYILYNGLSCQSVHLRTDLLSSDHYPLCATFQFNS